MAARSEPVHRSAAAIVAAAVASRQAGGEAADRRGAAGRASRAPAETRAARRGPVQAWVEFCERQPAECAVDPPSPRRSRSPARSGSGSVAVNAGVNAAVAPLTDEGHWGIPDLWGLPEDGYGDCEDYQLLKRKLLVEAGLPRRALRMTVVIDEKGEGHAVLMVRTDRGDFILDNKVRAVLPWHRTGYVFVKREGQDGPNWASLGGATSPATTANR